MKKLAVLGLAALFLVTGCGSKDDDNSSKKSESTKSSETKKIDSKNQVVCSGKESAAGQSISMKMTASLDSSDKVEKVSATITFNDKKFAEQYCSLYKAKVEDADKIMKCNGNSVEFSNYSAVVGDEIAGIDKDEFIEVMEDEGLTCK